MEIIESVLLFYLGMILGCGISIAAYACWSPHVRINDDLRGFFLASFLWPLSMYFTFESQSNFYMYRSKMMAKQPQ